MRLIDADAFDERVRAAGGMSEEELSEDFKDGVLTVLYMMSKQPTITAQPERKKGAWINEGRIIRCNRCKIGYATVKGMKSALTYKFCPNCGSDMREGEQNDEQASTNND